MRYPEEPEIPKDNKANSVADKDQLESVGQARITPQLDYENELGDGGFL